MPKFARRNAVCCGVLSLMVASVGAWAAQPKGTFEFPSRPIRIVVGFTPGGQPDIFSRMIGTKLTESLGQQIVVDNRPGAGGAIGTKIVADANPDGHTVLAISASHVISPAVRKLTYDTVKDFAGVTVTYNSAYLLVAPPSLGVRTVKDLIALAHAKPGQLNFGSAGTGSGTHFAGEMFKDSAKIDIVHVPYKGIPEALNDTITNRVQFFLVPLASSVNLVRDGKLRGLGVSSSQRVGIAPDIPTIAESGLPGFEWDSWGGIIAPAKTPRAIIGKLNREITRALRLPDIQERMRALGAEPAPSTPEAFDKLIAEQVVAVGALARKAGIRPQ
jgi:tripartite-type tricarboxylate transporter receptor subunit TctC